MPRYLFHVCNGTGFVPDEEGVELPDDDAARNLALRSARELMGEDIGRGVLDFASFIEIECEGRHLCTLTFKDVVEVKGL
jgi:hypothetical protein